jgi:iron complex outermembrane receptor protein
LTPARRTLGLLWLCLSVLASQSAYAQRSSEDAVAEALDAFGSTVGREVIGLYNTTNARGFSPTQAGNLRIDGFYFDPGATMGPVTRVVRGSSVHVGIAAQGYLFPAPTGVVDYQLRSPGNEPVGSVLIGYAGDGHVAYDENDVQLPIVRDVLSLGAGVSYSRNQNFYSSAESNEWTAGAIARWQPTESLEVTPFWGMVSHKEYGEEATSFIDNDGIPNYRPMEKSPENWAHLSFLASTFGTTARWSFAEGWQLAGALFRALYYSPVSYNPLVLNINGSNIGDFQVTALPATSSGATSGELRLSRHFSTGALRHALTLRLTGRDSNIESADGDTVDFGPANTTALPQVPMPAFDPGPITDVRAQQLVPGVAYQAEWQNIGQFTGGVQKVFYHRTVDAPALAPSSEHESPWLYNAAAAAYLPHALILYASYTRGFEEIGTAPLNAVNRNEPVPAQITTQLDAGLKYQLLPRLAVVGGIFEINKPYFNLDQANVYRHIGSTSNRGAEFSVTGDLTSRLNVVAGFVWIDPQVQYQSGAVRGPANAVAIGPVPGTLSAYFQYHPASLSRAIFGATIQTFSSRYADYPTLNVPAVTQLGLDVHYRTLLFHQHATFWLQAENLTNVNSVNLFTSGQVQLFEPRRVELSLVMDL